MNELYWLLLMVLNFGLILLVYRLFSVSGLYVWIAMSVIVANLQVQKTVELFGFTATLGNVVYATSFLATDILSEHHGDKVARKGVLLGFLSMACLTLFMSIAVLFEPSPDDFSSDAIASLFALVPRITIASLAAYLLAQMHDVWAFARWKRRFPSRGFLWVRNNLSTAVSQLVDSVVFTAVAFVGVFEWSVLLEIVVTTYLFKLAVALLDTACIYLAGTRRPPSAKEHGVHS